MRVKPANRHAGLTFVVWLAILGSVICTAPAFSYSIEEPPDFADRVQAGMRGADFIADVTVGSISIESPILWRECLEAGACTISFGEHKASIGVVRLDIHRMYPERVADEISVRCIVPWDKDYAVSGLSNQLVSLRRMPDGSVALNELDAFVSCSSPRTESVGADWETITGWLDAEFARRGPETSAPPTVAQLNAAVDRILEDPSWQAHDLPRSVPEFVHADPDTLRDVLASRVREPRSGRLVRFLYPVATPEVSDLVYEKYVADMSQPSPVAFGRWCTGWVLQIVAKFPGPERQARLIRILDLDSRGIPSSHARRWAHDPGMELTLYAGDDVRELLFLQRNASMADTRNNAWRTDTMNSIVSPIDRLHQHISNLESGPWMAYRQAAYLFPAASKRTLADDDAVPTEYLPFHVIAELGEFAHAGMMEGRTDRDAGIGDLHGYYNALWATGFTAEALDRARTAFRESQWEEAALFLGAHGNQSDAALLLAHLEAPADSLVDTTAILAALTRLGYPNVLELWDAHRPQKLPVGWRLELELVARAYAGDPDARRGLRALADGSYLHDANLYAHTLFASDIVRACQYFDTPEIRDAMLEYLRSDLDRKLRRGLNLLNMRLLFDYGDMLLKSLFDELERHPSCRVEAVLATILGIEKIPNSVIPGREVEFWQPYVEAYITDWRAARAEDASGALVN